MGGSRRFLLLLLGLQRDEGVPSCDDFSGNDPFFLKL